MDERLLGGFRLGEFFVEPPSGRVTGPEGHVRLPPKALETLLCLAARPRELVRHDEILERVWGQGVSRHDVLSQAISTIRQALGDDPGNPRFVQTLPRRGYRLLVAPAFGGSDQAAVHAAQTGDSGDGNGLFAELKRRGVIETGVAYLVIGWLLLQVADVTFGQLPLPAWALTFVTYLVIVGFPIALLLAWFIELTARGPRLDRPSSDLPRRSHFTKTYSAIVGAFVLASAGVFVYDTTIGLPEPSAERGAESGAAQTHEVEANSIAVLRFANFSGTDEGRIFAEGLAEDVINLLTRIPALRVSARGDAFSLDPNSASRSVRERLRVAYYIEGSVRLRDDMLRVVVQLIDSESGFHIVSRSFDRPRRDFFDLQDEITTLTVANLRVALPEETRASLASNSDATDVDAYVQYRIGMNALYEPITRDTLDEALTAFGRALEIDADYAAAHAGVCLAYVAGYPLTSDADRIESAENACAEALSLNPNLDVVHAALGELYAETGRYEEAEFAYEAALEINPKSVDSLIGLGDVYASQQQPEAAERGYERALGLQPGNWRAYNSLGWFYFVSGRYDEAAEQYREVVSLDVGNETGWANLGASLMLNGRFSEALTAFQRAVELEPTATVYSNMGLMHYYLGDLEQAEDAARTAVSLAPNDYLAWSNLGDVLVIGGDQDRAMEAFLAAERLAESQLEVNNRDPGTLMTLAWIKTMVGKPDEAQRALSAAAGNSTGDPYLHYFQALIQLYQGNRAGALVELEQAIEMGYPVAMIAAEPHLASLRDERRFAALIE